LDYLKEGKLANFPS